MDSPTSTENARKQNALFLAVAALWAAVIRVYQKVDRALGTNLGGRAEAFYADQVAQFNPIGLVVVGLVLGGVALVIGFAMLPIITAGTATAEADPNLTTGGGLVGVIPLGFILVLVVVGLIPAFIGIRQLVNEGGM